MSRYTIECETCGTAETGIAYRGEAIRHAHTFTGALPSGAVRITVFS